MHNKIQIILISYYRQNDLKECIESIIDNTHMTYHLSIIDNSSYNLNDFFGTYKKHPNISVFQNNTNLGKGRSFAKYYPLILQHDKNDFFISIDGDIKVYHQWLERLIQAKSKINQELALLAPTIMNKYGEWFNIQQKSKFIMHNTKNMYHYKDEIYYNRHTAGPLLLINRRFYDRIGGYTTNQLYGNDDGNLCKAAADLGYFIGIVSNVHVLHCNKDVTDGYIQWKHDNIKNPKTYTGYWD